MRDAANLMGHWTGVARPGSVDKHRQGHILEIIVDLPMDLGIIHGLILTPSGHEIPVESRVFFFAVIKRRLLPRDFFGVSHADPD
jgi:hypothetical protein